MIRQQPLPQEWCGAHHMDEREVDAAARVLRARSPFRFYGFDRQHETEMFEREFAASLGVRHALGVSSGTAALQVALGALGVRPGDEVIVPGYFWVATVGAVVRSGAIPVLGDVDESFSLDPDKLPFSPRTKAVIVVHMGGVIGRVRAIVAEAHRRGVRVLEDCAQAAGSSQGGIAAGAFGDISIFSFQLNKHMTSGEGGLVATSDPQLHRRAVAIHDLGYPRTAEGRLDFSDPELQLWGIGCRMSEVTAAIARVQLSKLPKIVGNMRGSKARILRGIADIKSVRERPVLDASGDAGSFLYLTYPTREQSLRALKSLLDEGLVAGPSGLYPIHMESWGLHIYYNIPSLVHKRGWPLESSTYSYGKGTCPVLDDLVTRTLLFCVASNLTPDDERDIIAGLRGTTS